MAEVATLRPIVTLNGGSGVAVIDFVLDSQEFIDFTYTRATGLVTAAALTGAGVSMDFDNYRANIAAFSRWLYEQIPATLGAPASFSGPFSEYAFGPIEKKSQLPQPLKLNCYWGNDRLIRVEWEPNGADSGTINARGRPALSLDTRHFGDWIYWHQAFIAAVQDHLAGRR